MVILIVCSHPFAASSVAHQQVINVKICVLKSTCVAPNSLAIFLGYTRGSAFQIVSGTLNIARRSIAAFFSSFFDFPRLSGVAIAIAFSLRPTECIPGWHLAEHVPLWVTRMVSLLTDPALD